MLVTPPSTIRISNQFLIAPIFDSSPRMVDREPMLIQGISIILPMGPKLVRAASVEPSLPAIAIPFMAANLDPHGSRGLRHGCSSHGCPHPEHHVVDHVPDCSGHQATP